MHNSTILTLNDVKDHFDHWRATRTKRGKIPACLWDEVKTLIGRYPTSQIAQTLHVNAYQISSGVNNKIDFTFVPARVTNSATTPAKSSLSISGVDDKDTCTFEIRRQSGCVLKITEFPVGSLAVIINQFME